MLRWVDTERNQERSTIFPIVKTRRRSIENDVYVLDRLPGTDIYFVFCRWIIECGLGRIPKFDGARRIDRWIQGAYARSLDEVGVYAFNFDRVRAWWNWNFVVPNQCGIARTVFNTRLYCLQ